MKVLLDEGTSIAPPKRLAKTAPSQSGSNSGIASAAIESSSVISPTLELSSISGIAPAADESNISVSALKHISINDPVSHKGIQVGHCYIYILINYRFRL